MTLKNEKLLEDKIKLMVNNLMAELIGCDEDYFKSRIKESYFDNEIFKLGVRFGMSLGLKLVRDVNKMAPKEMGKIKSGKDAW